MANGTQKKFSGFKFSHTVIIGVLSLVAGLGGGYGGYMVYENQGQFGAGFEDSFHVVERVVDGDTIVLDDKTSVRLLLIDAPELDQCFGLEAKEALQKLVVGQKVRLQKDFTATDFKDRLLRYVFIVPDHPKDSSIFVNEELLKSGHARFSGEPRDKLFQEVLSHTAGVAKTNQKGLYGKCKVESDIVKQESIECNIKGNYSPHTGYSYFLPTCRNYDKVVVEKSDSDRWFCSEKEAAAAGYQKAAGCP